VSKIELSLNIFELIDYRFASYGIEDGEVVTPEELVCQIVTLLQLDFGQFSKGRIRGMAENMEYAGFIAVSGTAETVRVCPETLAGIAEFSEHEAD
jgi:hypothetical protein